MNPVLMLVTLRYVTYTNDLIICVMALLVMLPSNYVLGMITNAFREKILASDLRL